jgi:hypothetical protein
MIILLLFYFLFLFINNLNFNNIENLENLENIEVPKMNERKDLHLKSPDELKTIIYDSDDKLFKEKLLSNNKDRKNFLLKRNIKFLQKKIKKLELELANKNKTNNNLKIPNLKDNTNNDKKNEIQNTDIIKPRWGYYKGTNEPAIWNGYSDPNITEYNN